MVRAPTASCSCWTVGLNLGKGLFTCLNHAYTLQILSHCKHYFTKVSLYSGLRWLKRYFVTREKALFIVSLKLKVNWKFNILLGSNSGYWSFLVCFGVLIDFQFCLFLPIKRVFFSLLLNYWRVFPSHYMSKKVRTFFPQSPVDSMRSLEVFCERRQA